MATKKQDGDPRLRARILETVSALVAKNAPVYQIVDEMLFVVGLHATKETERRSCVACNREFKSFIDFPRIHVMKFEMNPVPEFIAGTGDGENIAPIVSRVLGLDSVKKYLSLVGGKCHWVTFPRELLPDWMEDGLFKGAFIVEETFQKENAFIRMHDVEKEKSPVDDLGGDFRAVDIMLAFSGPNMGFAGGPTMASVHAIGRVTYEGVLDVSSIAREDEKELRENIDDLLAEGDEPLKCPGCGNTGTFRLLTWNCYFDAGKDGKVSKIYGGYYNKDIADMDDVIIVCPACDKIVLDTLW
jgi:hypothetical protein